MQGGGGQGLGGGGGGGEPFRGCRVSVLQDENCNSVQMVNATVVYVQN